MTRAGHDTQSMRTAARFRFVAIAGLTVALLSAGIGLAANAFDTSDDPQPTVCPTDDQVTSGDGVVVDEGDAAGTSEEPAETDEPTDPEGDTEEPADTDGDTEEPGDTEGDTEDEGDQQECDDEATQQEEPASDDAETEDAAAEEPTDERIGECTDAAGLNAADAPTEGPTPGELHGLENATAHVLWNCIHHDNPGLVNALTHLKANAERQLAHQEQQAERAAERAAAKAEREAAKAARKLSHEGS